MCSASSVPGTWIGADAARDSISLAARTSLPQRAPVAVRGGGVGVGEPLPDLRVAQLDELAEVADEGRVDVDAAEVVEAADAEDPQAARVAGAGRLAADHGHVEGATAEVEHGQGLQRGDLLAEDAQAVGGGGDRLVDEDDGAEVGGAGRLEQDTAALAAPVGGAGEHGGADRVDPGLQRLVGDPLQQGGEHLHDGDLGVAEQDRALVDAALRIRLETGRGEL